MESNNIKVVCNTLTVTKDGAWFPNMRYASYIPIMERNKEGDVHFVGHGNHRDYAFSEIVPTRQTVGKLGEKLKEVLREQYEIDVELKTRGLWSEYDGHVAVTYRTGEKTKPGFYPDQYPRDIVYTTIIRTSGSNAYLTDISLSGGGFTSWKGELRAKLIEAWQSLGVTEQQHRPPHSKPKMPDESKENEQEETKEEEKEEKNV